MKQTMINIISGSHQSTIFLDAKNGIFRFAPTKLGLTISISGY